MAVTFDNASTAVGTSVSTLQWTHTSVADSNPYLAIGTFQANAFNVSAIAYNSVALAAKQTVTSINRSELWTKVGINTGTLTVSANLTGSDVGFGCIACTYIGVAQANPASGNAQSHTSSGTNPALSLSSTAGGVAIAICATDGFGTQNYTNPGTQTQRGKATAGNVLIIFSEKATSNATTSFSWSSTASLNHLAMGHYLSATAIAASTNVFGLAMKGVGQ